MTTDDPACYIYLTRSCEATVSREDYERVKQYRWRYNGDESPYAKTTIRTNGKRRSVYLHRMVMLAPPGLEVHHKNANTLDCRRSNLAVVRPRSNNTILRPEKGACGFRGVYFRDRARGETPDRRNVRAYIWIGSERKYLGAFYTTEEAARAYDAASVDAFGTYADTNFPLSEYITPWEPPPVRRVIAEDIPF